MVIDTNFQQNNDRVQDASKALDVDRFYHHVLAPPSHPPQMEGTLLPGRAGTIYFCNYEVVRFENPQEDYCRPIMRESSDAGRTWSEPWPCMGNGGQDIRAGHISIFRLDDSELAMACNDMDFLADGPPGRDMGTKVTFRTSRDEGRTWSEPVLVYPLNALCTSGRAVTLSDGRILVPAYRWISHDASPESEQCNSPSLSYCFACFCDDGGRTWTVSHSQLFVSHYRLTCDLEEPTVVELKDGRILMHLRSQLGRPFRSFSKDRGLNWSRPEPLPMAASYTPSILKRMPTGEILTIWNQISRGEILKGFHRHRLSCAISRDDGQTWENFKNLESLDFRNVIEPPPLDRREIIEQWEDYGYYQPSDTEQYPLAPGPLRICYPDVVFDRDEAIIVYDYGDGTVGKDKHGIKLRAIPLDWFMK